MVSSKARSVDEYLSELPEDRRGAISAVRRAIVDNLPGGYEEVMQYGMISYCVPLERFPNTYNGMPLAVASIASQKQHMALYLMSVYGHGPTREWFERAWKKSGKKLVMGKSCVRFKKLEDVALDVIGEAIARVPVDAFVSQYERARPNTKSAAKKAPARKTTKGPAKTASARKAPAKTGAKKASAKKKPAKKQAAKKPPTKDVALRARS